MRPQESITCPVCGMTSYNPMDVAEGYCGNCHDWTRVDEVPNAEAIKILTEFLQELPAVHPERPGVIRAVEVLRYWRPS